jgi:hypothetical protein
MVPLGVEVKESAPNTLRSWLMFIVPWFSNFDFFICPSAIAEPRITHSVFPSDDGEVVNEAVGESTKLAPRDKEIVYNSDEHARDTEFVTVISIPSNKAPLEIVSADKVRVDESDPRMETVESASSCRIVTSLAIFNFASGESIETMSSGPGTLLGLQFVEVSHLASIPPTHVILSAL